MFDTNRCLPTPHTLARRWQALLTVTAAALGLLAPARCPADLVLAIDCSFSSPAMRQDKGAEFIAAVMPAVAQQVAALQSGERLAVIWIGDDSTIDLAVLNTRIQRARTAEGDTAAANARSLPRFIAHVTDQRRQSAPARQSQLTAGVANARSLIRAGQPCHIVLISDLVQADGAGWQYPRDLAKPFPRIPGLDLKGCDVTVHGAGQGLQPRHAQAMLAHWETWLKAAGAGPVTLGRY